MGFGKKKHCGCRKDRKEYNLSDRKKTIYAEGEMYEFTL